MRWQGQNSLESNSERYQTKDLLQKDCILFNVCINNMDAEYKTIFTKCANDEKLGRTKNLNQFCK